MTSIHTWMQMKLLLNCFDLFIQLPRSAEGLQVCIGACIRMRESELKSRQLTVGLDLAFTKLLVPITQWQPACLPETHWLYGAAYVWNRKPLALAQFLHRSLHHKQQWARLAGMGSRWAAWMRSVLCRTCPVGPACNGHVAHVVGVEMPPPPSLHLIHGSSALTTVPMRLTE